VKDVKMKGLAMLTLVLAVMCLPAVSIFAWQRMNVSPEDEAAGVAVKWIEGAPTFSFDGVAGSINVDSVTLAQTFAPPSFYIVELSFDCSHGGYGDRSGEMVLQVIEHHTATIHVTDGAVTLAVLDNVWDELNCAML
jgi:hypothetical protein